VCARAQFRIFNNGAEFVIWKEVNGQREAVALFKRVCVATYLRDEATIDKAISTRRWTFDGAISH